MGSVSGFRVSAGIQLPESEGLWKFEKTLAASYAHNPHPVGVKAVHDTKRGLDDFSQ
jgi:hypothetical protein